MAADPLTMEKLRDEANVKCVLSKENTITTSPCKPLQAPCLFDIIKDPCEMNNLATKYPERLSQLLTALERYNSTAVPAANLPIDPRGDPQLWDHTWTNFGDYNNILNNAVN